MLLSAVLVPLFAAGCRGGPEPAGTFIVEEPARLVATRDGAPVYQKVILTPVTNVDRIYRSMQGPINLHRFELGAGDSRELLWITAYDAVMVGADGTTPMSQEYMCHSNLSIRPGPGLVFFFPSEIQPSGGRLFSLAQGQLSLRLPPGFGVPVLANQTLQIAAQVLNLTLPGHPFDVRHKISVEFVRDRDLAKPLVAVMPRAVFAMKLLDGTDGYFGLTHDAIDKAAHGEGCQVGVDVKSPFPSVVTDPNGRSFTGHWVLKPGREENHTLVTRLLALPYDTTIHYAAVHLHPFAESIELRDRTARTTVVKSRARQADRGIGLAEVESFSSVEGVSLYKNHEYEVISVYNNTSGAEQDAMATIFLYLAVKDLDLSPYRRGATQGERLPAGAAGR